VDEDESVEVGRVVAVIAENEADIPALEAYVEALKRGVSGGVASPPATAAAPAAAPPAAATSSPAITGDRVVASPLAKKLASELNIDLATVKGTGPNGRVTVGDVESAKASPSSSSSSPSAAPTHTPASGVIAATPMARAAAKKAKLDLSKLSGTGEFNRITLDDVKVATGEKAKSRPKKTNNSPELPSGVVPYTGMQVSKPPLMRMSHTHTHACTL